MTTKQTATVIEQFNTLALESAKTFVDAAYLAQRQSAELTKAWLNTLSATQGTQQEIAGRLIKQAREAQTLWQELVRETVNAGTENFTRAAETGFNNLRQGVNGAEATVKEAAAKAK